MKQKVLIVTVEPLWPATHGGRVRTSKIAENLSANDFDVRVVFPERPGNLEGNVPFGLEQRPISWSNPGAIRRLHWLPWLGLYALSRTDLQGQIDRYKPDFVYWSHSYLAAVGGRMIKTEAAQLVEFANIESQRFLSFATQGSIRHRLSAAMEYFKACFWEKRVARTADVCVAISAVDEQFLAKLGGKTVTVENALPRNPSTPSPDTGTIVSVANWEYGPNRDGIHFFLNNHWHALTLALPHVRLLLAGNGSTVVAQRFSHLVNVQALGFVDDLTEVFRNSTLFLAPAKSGAGRQLKVAEALGHSRTVLGPPFLNREKRPGLPAGAVAGSTNIVQDIIERITNSEDRHIIEKEIAAYAEKHDWQFEAASLVNWMKSEPN